MMELLRKSLDEFLNETVKNLPLKFHFLKEPLEEYLEKPLDWFQEEFYEKFHVKLMKKITRKIYGGIPKRNPREISGTFFY